MPVLQEMMPKKQSSEAKDLILFFQNEQRPSTHTLPLLHLPHPKGGLTTYINSGGKLYELNVVNPRRHASWFIDQNVSSATGYYLATEVDIRFLLLPFFEKSDRRFSPLNQIVSLESAGDSIPLESFKELKMEQVFDVNDKLGDDMILFRYNEEKTLLWLQNKTRRCAAALSSLRASREGVGSASFVKGFNVSIQNTSAPVSTDTAPIVSSDDLAAAFQIVSEYLTEAMTVRLSESLGLTLLPTQASSGTVESSKRKADWEQALEIEKECGSKYNAVSTSSVQPAELPKKLLTKKPSVSAKSEKAPPRGTQSIASFFTKKAT